MKPHPILRPAVAPLAAIAALLVAGCTTSTYEVKVDAIAKHDSTNPTDTQSYKIQSRNAVTDDDSLRYKEAAEFVKTALSGKGLYEAPSADTADMIVEVDYGVGSPRTKIETVSVPVYAQVGGGVRYEQVPTTNARGVTSTRTVAVYEPPRTELVGFDDVPREVTIYEKYLRITARENKPAAEGKPPVQIWSVNTSTEDESKDLRKYLPIIASASVEYIGKDSSAGETIKVRVPSPTVDFIKKGLGDQPADTTVAAATAPKI
jgi:hypothetical protein